MTARKAVVYAAAFHFIRHNGARTAVSSFAANAFSSGIFSDTVEIPYRANPRSDALRTCRHCSPSVGNFTNITVQRIPDGSGRPFSYTIRAGPTLSESQGPRQLAAKNQKNLSAGLTSRHSTFTPFRIFER